MSIETMTKSPELVTEATSTPTSSGLTSKQDEQISNIVKFYAHKNVLITGASGFLGKVLLWKLISSCPDIGKIYVALRSKNSDSAQKRLISLLKKEPFSPKYDYAQLLNKVIAIDCDLGAENLGLSKTDRTLLEDEVDIVLHSAASVKFDAPLKDNIRDNVSGTCSLLKLCKSMKNLKSLCHVSTAYCNCHLTDIDERVIPLNKDVDDVLELAASLDDEACGLLTEKLTEKRPNTYTYTKAVAEQYVKRCEGLFPISIVRPSVVISSANEPLPGWVDNVNGIAGLGCLAAIGMLRTIDWNYYATSDMVPVDYVANCIICAAYEANVNSPKEIRVYNMTSGSTKPISWGKFFELLRNEAVARPTNKIVRPIIESPKHEKVNRIKYNLTLYLSEFLFAYLVDLIIAFLGYKKILVRITSKMHHGHKILKPFTTGEWNFKVGNLMNLSQSLDPIDQNLFKFDMTNFDWKRQANVTWDGARKWLLKEEPSKESFKSARARQRLVTIVHYTLMAIFISFSILIAYKTTRLIV